MQRRAAVPRPAVQIRPPFQQRRRHRRIGVQRCGCVQRRHPQHGVHLLNIRPRVQQQLGHRRVGIESRRGVQRRPAFRVPRLNIGAPCQQQRGHCRVPVQRRPGNQRRVPQLGGAVFNVRPGVQQRRHQLRPGRIGRRRMQRRAAPQPPRGRQINPLRQRGLHLRHPGVPPETRLTHRPAVARRNRPRRLLRHLRRNRNIRRGADTASRQREHHRQCENCQRPKPANPAFPPLDPTGRAIPHCRKPPGPRPPQTHTPRRRPNRNGSAASKRAVSRRAAYGGLLPTG